MLKIHYLTFRCDASDLRRHRLLARTALTSLLIVRDDQISTYNTPLMLRGCQLIGGHPADTQEMPMPRVTSLLTTLTIYLKARYACSPVCLPNNCGLGQLPVSISSSLDDLLPNQPFFQVFIMVPFLRAGCSDVLLLRRFEVASSDMLCPLFPAIWAAEYIRAENTLSLFRWIADPSLTLPGDLTQDSSSL